MTISLVWNKNNKTIKKTINFDDIANENTKEQNRTSPKTPNNPCKIMITGGYVSEKNEFIIETNKKTTRYW